MTAITDPIGSTPTSAIPSAHPFHPLSGGRDHERWSVLFGAIGVIGSLFAGGQSRNGGTKQQVSRHCFAETSRGHHHRHEIGCVPPIGFGRCCRSRFTLLHAMLSILAIRWAIVTRRSLHW
uniref:Uncharacterized protein n=1 Tax=Anopheles maculatus TaxID=74869 RepID=A0A182SRP3_9DIPT